MEQPFDPYQAWLNIAPTDTPPSHYRLLGLPEFIDDTDAIAEAAEQITARLKSLRPGKQAGAQRKLLQHIELAKNVLLNPTKKSLYDSRLRASATRIGAPLSSRAPSSRAPSSRAPSNSAPGNSAPGGTQVSTAKAVRVAELDDDIAVAVDDNNDESDRDDDEEDEQVLTVRFSVAALAAKLMSIASGIGARLGAIVSTRRRRQIRDWAARTSAGVFLACLFGGLLAVAVLGYVSYRLINRAKATDNSRPRPAAGDLDADLAAHSVGAAASATDDPTPSASSTDDSLIVARRLEHIRRALADRRIVLARDHLAAALDEPQSESQKAELTQLSAIADLLEEFWSATRATVAALKPGDEAQVAGHKLPVTAAAEETLTVQLGQFPTTFTIENMPIELAIGLAAQQTTTNVAHAQAILGALQAMDAAGDRSEAKRLWAEAATGGEPTDKLTPELEKSLPAGVHAAPQIARVSGGDQSPAARSPEKSTNVAAANAKNSANAQAPPMAVAPPITKRAAPDESRQQEIRSQFRQLYAAEFEMAKDAGEKTRLAEKLLQLGAKFEAKPVNQFVLCSISRELATDAGNVELALRAIDAQDRYFVVDVFESKASALEKIAASEANKKAKAAVVDAAQSLVEQAVQADEIEAAARLLRAGLEVATASSDQPRAKELRLRQRDLMTLQKAFAEALPALEQLRADPTNATANRLVGNWYCLQKGNWSRGLSYLAQGDESRVAALAKAELAAPTESDQWQRLADGWLDLADSASGLAKLNLQRRARYWSERVLPTLQGDAKASAQTRLAALPDLAPPLEPPSTIGELRQFTGRFAADGRGVLAADGSKLLLLQDKQIAIFDLTTGEQRFLLEGHEKAVLDARLSADGRRAISLGADDALRAWDATNGTELHKFPVFMEGNAANLVVSREGKRAAFTTRDSKLVRVWDCESGKGMHQFACGGDEIVVRTISADGRRALAVGDGKVHVWDVVAGKEVNAWESGIASGSCRASLSLDNQTALLGAGKDLSLWRIVDKRELAHLITHGSEITAVAVSPDNRRVLSGHDDGTLVLWDVTNRQRLQQFKGHTGPIAAATFTPDGRRALSSSDDGTVRVWGLPR
jgi:hypothetical protein